MNATQRFAFKASDVVMLPGHLVTRAASAARDNTLLHRTADRYLDSLHVKVAHAFMLGRRHLKQNKRDAVGTANVVREALLQSLPKALAQIVVAGGVAGLTMISRRLRTATATNTSLFDLSGLTPDQQEWAVKALAHCTFDFSRLLPRLYEDAGRSEFILRTRNMNPDLPASSPGMRPEEFTYAMAYYDGSIELDETLSEDEFVPTLLEESAHLVDFFYLTDDLRKRLVDVYVSENNATTRPVWFYDDGDPLAGDRYYEQVGESFMVGFVKTFTDVAFGDQDFDMRATPIVIEAVRQVLGPPLMRTAAGPFNMKFDATNPDVVRWAREHAVELAKNLGDTTEQDIKDVIARGLEEGNLDEVFDDVLNAVGDPDRAQLIARTEIMTAANEGQRQGWSQAVDDGLLPSDSQVAWIATTDACAECDDLDGETRDLDGAYPDPGGDGPPLHPNCRCTEGIIG